MARLEYEELKLATIPGLEDEFADRIAEIHQALRRREILSTTGGDNAKFTINVKVELEVNLTSDNALVAASTELKIPKRKSTSMGLAVQEGYFLIRKPEPEEEQQRIAFPRPAANDKE